MNKSHSKFGIFVLGLLAGAVITSLIFISIRPVESPVASHSLPSASTAYSTKTKTEETWVRLSREEEARLRFRLNPEAAYSPLPTGPIRDANDAEARAVAIANEKTLKAFDAAPFRTGRSPALFDGKHWVWRGRVGAGKGDLEAFIRLAPDGTVDSSMVRPLYFQLDATRKL
jgi:hypothetical protein